MKKIVLFILGIAVALVIVPTTRDEIHWLWASCQDDSACYESYLTTWPSGRHSALAMRIFDERVWSDAVAANTIRGFERYLQVHPGGKHVASAKDMVQSLRVNDAVYSAAFSNGTEDALRRFLTEFPDHARQADAQQALKDITEGRDIVDVLDEKKIAIETQGGGIENVTVKIRRLVPYPLNVRIPVGTFFVAARQSAQNMVTTVERRVTLVTNEWHTVSVSVACANRPRDIPGGDDTFAVQRSPNQEELALLMPILDGAGASSEVRQAAVWIVTDNADYEDLGILVSGFGGFGPRVIDEEDAARAMMLCEQAGIDITKRAIWRDRLSIHDALSQGERRTWLEQKN